MSCLYELLNLLNGGWLVPIVSGLLFWQVGGLAEGVHESVVVGS